MLASSGKHKTDAPNYVSHCIYACLELIIARRIVVIWSGRSTKHFICTHNAAFLNFFCSWQKQVYFFWKLGNFVNEFRLTCTDPPKRLLLKWLVDIHWPVWPICSTMGNTINWILLFVRKVINVHKLTFYQNI